MSNVISFPGRDEALNMQRYDAMFTLIHTKGPSINDFSPELGTPDEWLGAAMQHMACVMPSGPSRGMVTVSAAALSLIMMKLEELHYGGPPVNLTLRD
jgi:hypothetical protein